VFKYKYYDFDIINSHYLIVANYAYSYGLESILNYSNVFSFFKLKKIYPGIIKIYYFTF